MTANAERLTDVEINLHFSPRPTVDSASEATFSAKGTFRDPVKLRNKLENKQAPLGHSHDPTAELSDLGGGSASTRRCALTEVAMLTFVKLFFVVVVFNNIQLNGSTKLMPATGGDGGGGADPGSKTNLPRHPTECVSLSKTPIPKTAPPAPKQQRPAPVWVCGRRYCDG